MALSTARIPELPPLTAGLDLDLSDKLPIYIASENKTRRVTLQQLNTFFATGGGGSSHAPVEFLGEVIYVVPSSAAGTDTASIPSLAGKDFTLERGGMPLIPLLPDNSNSADAEYEILDAGGFKLLKAADVLTLNERFKLIVYSLISTTPTGSAPTTFILGKKQVVANTSLDSANDVNKVIQVRGDTSAIVVTLPDVADVAANSVVIIETQINNTKPCTVQTTGGQYVYLNSSSKTAVHLHPGEVIWLFRDTDGWYVLNDSFGDKYRQLAKPQASFKADIGQLVCKGQEVLRADYPRLWEYVQTLGTSLVDKTTWETASVTVDSRTVLKPYRGCFHTGNGTTTFGLPDLMEAFLRGVKSETGSDAQRHLNKPGGYQDETVKVADGLKALKITGTFTYQTGDNTAGEPNLVAGHDISTGPETRPGNIGTLWTINY